ncbi:2-deoxy-D-gluconate 3-dehydrogenase [Myriangium duriaei CBS 260.36]|uniref:2-deoxy-D-gluconate 3-dehydrogenase n=1 Tax=Myriangium duriaei CBS 260.36 TaxID=1168546 RepID=A0A9P4IXJ3_9PEZI|nr:2-deoxy-D-gluconate 3-dehydrogenase [Myriangium duriaei CBS 260.36]
MTDYLPSLFSLHGKTAVVTGGTRGIGAAMALALAQAGADIILVQRDSSNTTTATSIRSLSRRAEIVTADLSDPKSVSSLTPHILTLVPRIDILLNCAGIQSRAPAETFPLDAWDSVLSVNLTTPFILARDVGAHMLSQQPDAAGSRGRIINIASLLTFQGGINVPAYAASKGGVAQLTKALSNQWAGRGVGVNAVAPGYIGTDMNEALINDEKRAGEILGRIPAGRWGKPEDFAGVVVWLASSRASGYVTGEIVTVDGGWMAR